MTPVRYVLLGDGESPHLLKWARALATVGQDRLQLGLVSTRGRLPAFDQLVPPERCLCLQTQPRVEGGNAALLRQVPRVARWLRGQSPHVLHAHYLTSAGTLAWLSRPFVPGSPALVSSAWGSDILVTPVGRPLLRQLTRRVLQASVRCTSDSQHMAAAMKALGARLVDVFPFGLESVVPPPGHKDPDLFFANRALEPLYDPHRVIRLFALLAQARPQARLALAHAGSLLPALQQQVQDLGLGERVRFLGHLQATDQAHWYAQAQWFISLPRSDSVSVSVLEAMAHGCIPLLSDLPANRELVQSGWNGLVIADGHDAQVPHDLHALDTRAQAIAQHNHQWVQAHAQFQPSVQAFLHRLGQSLHLKLVALPSSPTPAGPAAATPV